MTTETKLTVDAPNLVRPSAVLRTANQLLRPWTQALTGGILTTLTVPPFGWWPLAIPGIALLYSALLSARRRRGTFGLGLLWGSALYVPSLWWMTAFSLPGGIFVGLLEATITALTLAVIVPRQRNVDHFSVALHFISALMIADALRSLWPFGGLPLGGIDLGQANGWFAPVVSWAGRLGLIGLVSAVAVIAPEIALRFKALARSRSRVLQLATGLGLCLLLPVLATDRHDRPLEERASIMVVQGGGPRGLLASSENAQRTFDAHLEATTDALTLLKQSASSPSPDLVLWPENTVDTDAFTSSDRFDQIRRLTGTNLSVGITEDGGPTQFLNAQVMISPDGQLVDRYDKVRRVPFGEYFPFRKQIEGWGLADLPKRDARPGTTAGTLRAGTTTYGVLISYEGFFDDRSRNAVNAGAQVLLIPTNASSYKTTQLPSQQVAAAQLRAMETHRDVVQVGPTGYSAFVNPRGQVSDLSALGERDVFTASVVGRSDKTPYVRFNDVPALLAAALLSAIAFARRKVARPAQLG